MKKVNFLRIFIIFIFFNIYLSFVSADSNEVGVNVRVIDTGENVSIEKQNIDRISMKDLITGRAIIELEKKDVIVTLSVIVLIILIVYILIRTKNKKLGRKNEQSSLSFL